MKSAFTLIEVLVSLTVLTFLLTGSYSVISSSINMSIRSKEKFLLEDKAYERYALKKNYPNLFLPVIEVIESESFSFKDEMIKNILDNSRLNRLTVSSSKGSTSYAYFQ